MYMYIYMHILSNLLIDRLPLTDFPFEHFTKASNFSGSMIHSEISPELRLKEHDLVASRLQPDNPDRMNYTDH